MVIGGGDERETRVALSDKEHRAEAGGVERIKQKTPAWLGIGF